MKIYTKTGDDGTTGLYGGVRVSKTDARIEACGAVDELNALLGVVRANGPSPSIDPILAHLQNQLFDLGAELATPDASAKGTDYLQDSDVAQLEAWIDQLDPALPELKTFILPGGSPVRGVAPSSTECLSAGGKKTGGSQSAVTVAKTGSSLCEPTGRSCSSFSLAQPMPRVRHRRRCLAEIPLRKTALRPKIPLSATLLESI